jgi:hypothetical protein
MQLAATSDPGRTGRGLLREMGADPLGFLRSWTIAGSVIDMKSSFMRSASHNRSAYTFTREAQ